MYLIYYLIFLGAIIKHVLSIANKAAHGHTCLAPGIDDEPFGYRMMVLISYLVNDIYLFSLRKEKITK